MWIKWEDTTMYAVRCVWNNIYALFGLCKEIKITHDWLYYSLFYLRAKLNDKNMPKSVKNRTLNVTQHFVDGWPSETNPYPIPADPLDQHRGTKPVRKRPTAQEPLPARKRKKTVSEDPRVEAAESLISLSQQILRHQNHVTQQWAKEKPKM